MSKQRPLYDALVSNRSLATDAPIDTASEQMEQLLNEAIQLGAARYFAACRQRVAPFVRRHFRYPGAVQTNKHALGWDLLRAPLNLFWAPFYLLLMLLSWGVQRVGWHSLARWLGRVPAGMDTRVQDFLVRVCYQELLQRPLQTGDKDALREAIVLALEEKLALAGWASDADLTRLSGELQAKQLNRLIEEALDHYAVSRTATADIANSVISMLVGLFAFQKYTPGGLAVGLYMATLVAKWLAVDEFWAGPLLGQLYYAIIPATPSASVTFVSIAITLVLLAIVACFSGLIIDPLQAIFGLHQWRLRRLIGHLEKDFQHKTNSRFRPKEAYIARLLDLIDAARMHLS